MTLVLMLSALPFDRVRGTYTVGGVPGRMPDRALFLQPAAAQSFLHELADEVTVSDVFRSPASSLAAVRAGRGAKAPGYSGHNYGLSIDLDIEATVAAMNAPGRPSSRVQGYPTQLKRWLDEWMAARGWLCHRSDHAPASWKPINEAWHYNFLPDHTWGRSSPAALEARIVELYGDAFAVEARGIQSALASLKPPLYRGELDGRLGPLSTEGIRAFQRTWNLPETGKADARTQRTLAYVTAEVELAR